MKVLYRLKTVRVQFRVLLMWLPYLVSLIGVYARKFQNPLTYLPKNNREVKYYHIAVYVLRSGF